MQDKPLTACHWIPYRPHRLGSEFAYITAGLDAPIMQLALLIGSHLWEMPNRIRSHPPSN